MFNRVPNKVPGFRAARSGSTRFRRKFRRRSGRLLCSQVNVQQGSGGFLVQGQVKFNKVPDKVSEKVPEGFRAEPGQVQQGSGEGSGEVLKVWEALCSQVKFNRVPEALVQSQVKSNKVPDKVPAKFPEGFRAERGQVQRGSGEGSEGSGEGLGGFGAARSGSTGFRKVPEKVPGSLGEVFPAFGFVARFRKFVKIERMRLLGIPPFYLSLMCIHWHSPWRKCYVSAGGGISSVERAAIRRLR